MYTENSAMMERAQNQDDTTVSFSYSWAMGIYLDPAFTRKAAVIRRGMTANFSNTLIVTSTKSYPSPDFIVKALSISQKGIEILHTWQQVENSKFTWLGSIAFYKKWKHLKEASDHIVRNFEDIQVIYFPDVIQLLVIAESSHRLYGVGVSIVIIKGRRSFEKEEFSNFRKMMNKYGDLKMIKFRNSAAEFGEIAVAEYRFATHAFVAKFHLHGRVYSDIGFLHAEIVMTEKEKSVKSEATHRYLEHVNSES